MLIRDMRAFTDDRIISVDKEGVTANRRTWHPFRTSRWVANHDWRAGGNTDANANRYSNS